MATKEILVVAGFDETGFLGGTNGEYELLDASATGTAREWHGTTNNMRIVWYSSGSYWCIAGKDNMYWEVCAGENVTDPWDTTWYFMGNAISGATVTKKANADGGNGGSSDIPASGFKVTGVTSPVSLNGVYSLTSGDISDLSSCQWTNENGGHLKYFSGGYWIFGDSSNPANTPGDCFYYGQGMDKKPWEITSWSDGSYSHSGTLVLTVGGYSGGSGTPLFNVSELTTTSANGDYWLTNEGATGYDRVFTNGVAYCIGHTELYDPSVPEAGYQIVQWMICEGDSYENRGTIYAISGVNESLTADPWDCYFLDDKTGSGITITKIESESGGGGSSDTEKPTPEEPSNNVAFTVAGCSYEDLNGDWIEESANGYVKADDSTKKCTMDYGPGFWRFWSTATDMTLVNTSDTKDNPWEVEWWYDTLGDKDESSMTVTKSVSGSEEDESESVNKFTISGCYTTSDVNTTYTLTSGSGKNAVYTADNGCTVITENNSWVVKHPMGGNILFAYDDSYMPITNVDNPWEISMWYDNMAGSRYTISFSDIVTGGGSSSVPEEPEVEDDYPSSLQVSGAIDYIDPGVWNVDGIYNKSDELNEGKPVYKNTETPNKCIKYNNGYWRIYSYDAVSDYLYICQTDGNLDLNVKWTANTAHVIGVVSVVKHNDTEQPEVPEQPSASFGTYLQISGNAAVNDGLDGIYKLNESASTDIYKEWIKQGDDTKKVNGGFVDIDPATYWTVRGGSDNYFTTNWESIMSYPWNADNSSFVWYYHGEIVDFHVTPYVSDEEDPSIPETPSVPVEPDTPESITSVYTITGSNNSSVNGDYVQIDDINGSSVYKHVDNEMYIYAMGGTDWVIATSTTIGNPGQAEYWASGNIDSDIAELAWSTVRSQGAITVVKNGGSTPDTPTTDSSETTLCNVLTLSGVGTGTNAELNYGADVAMNGEYTIVDAAATGTDREWRMTGSNGTTYSVYWGDSYWNIGTYVTNNAYSSIFYPNEYNTENPWIDENTSLTFWAGPNKCNYVKLLPKATSSGGSGSNGGSNGSNSATDVSSVTVDGVASYYCGSYNKTDSAASGKNAVYQNSSRRNLSIKYDSCWVIVDTDDPNNWAFHATVDADNPWEVPQGSWRDSTSFVNDFIITPNDGNNGSSSSTSNSLIVTNGGDMNGTYNLTDPSATGFNRVWENSENGMRITGYDAWGVTEWVIQQWNSSDEAWSDRVYASGNNPYKDDGSSLRWGYGDSISEVSVVLATSVGGNDGGSVNVANTITVSNAIYPSVVGDYKKIDSNATGKNAIYINEQEGYIIKYVDIRWEIRHVMESLIYYATQDADNPWEVPQNNWWFEMGLETDHGITITVVN